MQRIVIVGGGAGGLELATRLGRKLGRSKKAYIELIDVSRTHLWKPLLHEVATGALDSGIDELDYLVHGRNHGFRFQLGRMQALDREKKDIILAPILDANGNTLAPERRVHYDILVIAIGSITNDFGTLGAKDNCFFLDNRTQADRFHQTLLNEFLRANTRNEDEDFILHIGIVGAGATGVELSAELYNTAEILVGYGLDKLQPKHLRVHLIEAGPRILPALSDKIAQSAHAKLESIGVSVHTNTMITEVTNEGFKTKDGKFIPAHLRVWAAGVRAQDFLSTLGLETNRAHQLIVDHHLQTNDASIFAIGDCSFTLQESGKPVPPRAQAAHQEASHMYQTILALRAKKPLPIYEYKDHGSLVSLSDYSAVGNIISAVTPDSFIIEGKLARIMYVSLYRLHQIALHGYWRTLLITLVGRINRVIRPRLKLH